MKTVAAVWMALSFSAFAVAAVAQESIGEPGRGAAGPNALNNVYFGEQHLHTSASPDAFAFGTRTDANDAYDLNGPQGDQFNGSAPDIGGRESGAGVCQP